MSRLVCAMRALSVSTVSHAVIESSLHMVLTNKYRCSLSDLHTTLSSAHHHGQGSPDVDACRSRDGCLAKTDLEAISSRIFDVLIDPMDVLPIAACD